MSANKLFKRYTHDATGVVLGIRPKINNENGIKYKVIEFDDCLVHVPWYIAHTIQVGDNIHAYFIPPHWTTDMHDLEHVVIHLNHIADYVFQDHNVKLGYCELLGYLDGIHHGFWVVKHL